MGPTWWLGAWAELECGNVSGSLSCGAGSPGGVQGRARVWRQGRRMGAEGTVRGEEGAAAEEQPREPAPELRPRPGRRQPPPRELVRIHTSLTCGGAGKGKAVRLGRLVLTGLTATVRSGRTPLGRGAVIRPGLPARAGEPPAGSTQRGCLALRRVLLLPRRPAALGAGSALMPFVLLLPLRGQLSVGRRQRGRRGAEPRGPR